MSLNYGEGEDHAFQRLRRKIDKAYRKDGNLNSPDLAAKPLEQELVEVSKECYTDELSWGKIVKRWERGDRCTNCGSDKHWERDCPKGCGKCKSFN